MKKKILLLALLSSSMLGMAKVGLEGQLKFGFDAYRTINNLSDLQQYREVKQGFDLNLDLIPFNFFDNRLEFGLGVGYVGGMFRLYPSSEIEGNDSNLMYQIPVYALMKSNIINLDSGDSPLYMGLKGGYSFIGSKNPNIEISNLGGAELGFFIGSEFRNFVAELFYDGTFMNVKDTNTDKSTDYSAGQSVMLHRIGVQLGIRFGSQTLVTPKVVEIKAPKPVETPKPVVVVPKPVQIVKTVEVVKPVVVEVPKTVEVVKTVEVAKPVVQAPKTVEVIKPVVVEVQKPAPVVAKPEPKKVEAPKPVVKPKPQGTVIKDVRGGANTGLELGEFSQNRLPDILYIKEDGYLYTPNNSNKLYGSNGDTDAKTVYIEKDGEMVFHNGGPLLLRIFKTDTDDFKIVTDKKGKRIVTRDKTPKAEKIVFFPNKCEGDKCIINGFVSNGKKPTADEIEQIKYFVKTINDFANSAKLEIVGFTDSQGAASYNKKLGLVRAQSIANLLKENGLKRGLRIMDVYSEGEDYPIANNSTAEGRYKNRRVEIIFHDMVK